MKMNPRSLSISAALTLAAVAIGIVVSGISITSAYAFQSGEHPPTCIGPSCLPPPPPGPCTSRESGGTPCGGGGGDGPRKPTNKTIKAKIPTSGAAKANNIQQQNSTGGHTKK